MHHGSPSVLIRSLWALVAAAISVPAAAADLSQQSGTRTLSPARETELARLVRHDCGSCHGLTLQGGLGPALTPSALAGKPPAYLKAMILDGRRGTAMPGWRPLLSEVEATWIAENLSRGLPDAR